MSGLLFLCAMIGFVVIAYWAFKNDAMGPNECGSGLFAMKLPAAVQPKSAPKWKKTLVAEGPRRTNRRETAPRKPSWRRTLLYGSVR